MRASGADSIDPTRKVYTMNTKTHVVAPVMIAASVATVFSIAFASPASALRGRCGDNNGGGVAAAAIMKRGGCDDFRQDLQRVFHDRDDRQQLKVPRAAK